MSLLREKDITQTLVRQFATMKSAYDQCSPRIQTVIQDLLSIITDDSCTEEDKRHACDVIEEAMFPSKAVDIQEQDRLQDLSPESHAEREKLLAEEKIFGDRLRELMRVKEFTQERLAAETGVSQPAISNILNRNCRPQRRTIARLASALGVEPSELWPEHATAEQSSMIS